MIVNDRYKFIFVHVPKSGGSSVAKALQTLEGNNRTLVSRATKHQTLAEFYSQAEKRFVFFRKSRTQNLGRYFKFGFVRHPWDRLASLYAYLKEKRPRKEIDSVGSFAEFLEMMEAGNNWVASLHSARPQHGFFLDEQARMAADFIGNFEMLEEHFGALQKRCGMTATLPHANKSSHSGADYRSVYTDKLVELVQRRFAKDISVFGYQFESKRPLFVWDDAPSLRDKTVAENRK